MTTLIRRTGIAVAMACLLPAPAGSGVLEEVARNYALVIGVDRVSSRDDDQIPRLRFAVADAKSIRDELLRTGRYEVTYLADETADRRSIIRSFDRIAREARPQDSFLLFFAGHGLKSPVVSRQTHWVTYGTTVADIEVDGLRMSHVLDYVQGIRAGRKIMILDHCFSGDAATLGPQLLEPGLGGPEPAAGTGASRSGFQARALVPTDDVPDALEMPAPEHGGVAIYGAAYSLAFETPAAGHGLFTAVILEAFAMSAAPNSRRPGVLELNELNGFLEEWRHSSASTSTSTPQKPFVWRGGTLTNWHVIDLTGTEAMIHENELRYREHLDTLHQQGDIELAVKRHYEDAITEWREALIAKRNPSQRTLQLVGLLSRLTSDVRSRLQTDQRGRALSELVTALELPQ